MSVYLDTCEFCGQKKLLVSTSFGVYCLDCFKIIRDECENAIDELEEREE